MARLSRRVRASRPNLRRAALLAGIACLALLSLSPEVPTATAAAPPAPACGGSPRRAEVLQGSPKTADGYREAEAWLLGPAGQVAASRLTQSVGADPAVIGMVPDYAARSMVVVYDPTAPSAGAVEATARAFKGLAVSLRKSCQHYGDLVAARDGIGRLDWGPSAKSVKLISYIDAESDSLKVIVPPGPAATELRQRFGKAVTVVEGNPREYQGDQRNGDVSAHWGGSLLVGRATMCTAGFTATNFVGFRGSSTAAHCTLGFANEPFYTAFSTNPAFLMGYSAGNPAYPFQDFQWIWAPGQSYTNVIHVDPCCPTQRSVIAAGDPPLFSSVCVSGAFTGASCGATVISTNAQFCGSGICRQNTVYAYVAPYTPLAGPGDSGAPVYAQSGSCCAIARGTAVGGAFGNDVFFEKPSSMDAAGLHILTTP